MPSLLLEKHSGGSFIIRGGGKGGGEVSVGRRRPRASEPCLDSASDPSLFVGSGIDSRRNHSGRGRTVD
eukprot:1180577-Prorocentrum_minimum.AAC.6